MSTVKTINMTIAETLKKYYQKLLKTTKNPAFEAEFLLAHILQKPREFILAHPEKKLTKAQIAKYIKLIFRRTKGEPLAYLTGNQYFFGNKFITNKNALIPRPETELIVEEINNLESNNHNSTIIDIGTGSGCIIISLAKILKNKNHQFYGIDISSQALSIAKKNAKLNGVYQKIKFLQGNLLSPILKFKSLNLKSKIIILANLPYLTEKQIKANSSLRYEPRRALFGGLDGLDFYRELFYQLKELTKSKPTHCTTICEIDPSQMNKLKNIITREFPQAKIKIKNDLAKRDRFVIVEIY